MKCLAITGDGLPIYFFKQSLSLFGRMSIDMAPASKLKRCLARYRLFQRLFRLFPRSAAFNILKFRTMSKVTPVDVPTNNLVDVQQTRWQKFLRQTSLDELPQLINILKGDMSFVGPRPVIFEEQDLINEREKLGANDVLPGLTGWAQVNGRDDLGYEEKAKLDAEYVSKMSFLFDIKCLFLTFFCVVRQENIKKFD